MGTEAKVSNLNLECNINAKGSYYVGGIAGYNQGTIENVTVNATILANGIMGGLIGSNYGGSINDTHVNVNIIKLSGNINQVGGLIGVSENNGNITNSSSSGFVNGQYYVGGLVGEFKNGNIEHSSSSAEVTGHKWVGGFIGNCIRKYNLLICYRRCKCR